MERYIYVGLDGIAHSGRLATDHAASSHGLPVLVGLDGEPLGPADVEAIVIPPKATETERELLRGAIRAGYLLRGTDDDEETPIA